MLLSPEVSTWYEVTNGHLADLPLQRLSRTHRGWQMAVDGSWSPLPGDVFAGCRTDTPDTWTASAGGAAHVPAPHYHGNLLRNGTQVHLVSRFTKKERWDEIRRGSMQSLCLWCCYCALACTSPHQCSHEDTHQAHALLGCQKSLWHIALDHCGSFLCYKSVWCWGTFH